MSRSIEINQRVIKMTQELLAEEREATKPTPDVIVNKLELVLGLNPKWTAEINRDEVIEELIRRFSVWIGVDVPLTSGDGHEAWLEAARKTDWRYWQRYSEWMERKISLSAVAALDKSTDLVMSLIEDPARFAPWDRRGLVVGHVQSGKTAHYTGVICKAADAGYKIIIVLAGLHNNLRSQTQIRLDEGFLGYETRTDQSHRVAGVGEVDSDPAIRPNYATNRSETGDFTVAIARNLGISPEQRPWLFVVKKNKSVLERLLQWIRNHVADVTDAASGRRLVTQFPLLLIDDEADHASVDTKEQVFGEDGKADPEHEPTAINSRIRKILHSFNRAAYVGYTATPFANIFIHERAETLEEGPDLFPRSFIVNLAAPSNYVGPQRVFGTPSPEGRGSGLPLVRTVDDFESEDKAGWMPSKHKNGHVPLHRGRDELPSSLTEAINAFVISCAVRNLRGHRKQHASMLVHVTRFNSVQKEVYRQVDEYLRHLAQRVSRGIGAEHFLDGCRQLYEKDFLATTNEVVAQRLEQIDQMPSWGQVLTEIRASVADIRVRMINGTAKDVLDYSDQGDIGLKVIAIGGDKLARGLTLEGLSVSYFLRASRMYDTLMQMGRWFGYRPGYLDLCRLYTTEELSTWFAHIADASEELREEFEIMAANGSTPREYGLKVQSHPILLVTSRLKMRAARDLLLSFSGELLETVVMHRDQSVLSRNLVAADRLLTVLGSATEIDPVRKRGEMEQRWKGMLWSAVKAEHVIEFLTSYRTHPEAYKVRSDLLAQFITSMNESAELTDWAVAFIGGGEGAVHRFNEDVKISMLKRTNSGDYSDRYSIGRLLSPRDESIDVDNDTWSDALSLTRKAWTPDPARGASQAIPEVPSGPALRHIRGFGGKTAKATPNRGLLMLYFLDPALAGCNFPRNSAPVVAFGISFPGSSGGKKVAYKVNSVQWQQWEREYGASE
jgi:hypothetical protein